MRRLPVVFSVLAVSLMTTSKSWGWGHEGHHFVGEIAMQYMSKAAQDSVKKYLGSMTIESATTWMDDVRGTDEGRKMGSWHYINVPKGEDYKPMEGDNIINHIDLAIKNLKNRKNLTPDEITFNIKVLCHLIGDLQMPLHSGYKEDLGGNKVQVTYNGKNTNLHGLWDYGIIEGLNITEADCLAAYKSYTPAQIREIEQIDDVAWMKQGRAYLDKVYDFKDGIITDTYVQWAKPIIEKQILCGGLRLAAVMNELFGK